MKKVLFVDSNDCFSYFNALNKDRLKLHFSVILFMKLLHSKIVFCAVRFRYTLKKISFVKTTTESCYILIITEFLSK